MIEKIPNGFKCDIEGARQAGKHFLKDEKKKPHHCVSMDEDEAMQNENLERIPNHNEYDG